VINAAIVLNSGCETACRRRFSGNFFWLMGGDSDRTSAIAGATAVYLTPDLGRLLDFRFQTIRKKFATVVKVAALNHIVEDYS
jgi:hypothetical protein